MCFVTNCGGAHVGGPVVCQGSLLQPALPAVLIFRPQYCGGGAHYRCVIVVPRLLEALHHVDRAPCSVLPAVGDLVGLVVEEVCQWEEFREVRSEYIEEFLLTYAVEHVDQVRVDYCTRGRAIFILLLTDKLFHL